MYKSYQAGNTSCEWPISITAFCIFQKEILDVELVHVYELWTTKLTSGLNSNISWSPVRKSSLGKSCIFSQMSSTYSIGSIWESGNQIQLLATELHLQKHNIQSLFIQKASNTASHEYMDSYLLLIVKLICFNLLNLFIYSEYMNKHKIITFIHPRLKLRCHQHRHITDHNQNNNKHINT